MSRGDIGSTRRGFLSRALGIAATTPALAAAGAAAAVPELRTATAADGMTEPFWGVHQGGILTPAQAHTYFAAFDLTAAKRSDVVDLLQAWTQAAAKMATGKPVDPMQTQSADSYAYNVSTTTTVSTSAAPPAAPVSQPDSGESLGLSPSRLTLTFGFGAGLFVKDEHDRYGLASRRPEALIDLPKFAGDQLVDGHTGGDLSVQACADDPQVAFHAVRQLVRIAGDRAQMRWAQAGFIPGFGGNETPRNLMGFRDGTNNPSIHDPAAMDKFVWVGKDGPAWMQGGSYVVIRRIRVALEHWDRTPVSFQEQTVGRRKHSGAPLGSASEHDSLDLDATGKDGSPVIPETAHVRLAAAASNDGARILRRPYSYNDGVNFTAERWPPWRQGLEYDAGLFFIAYQSDPRSGFVKIFDRMAKLDMMNQFVTHVGGGLFACPRGADTGEYIGQRLFA